MKKLLKEAQFSAVLSTLEEAEQMIDELKTLLEDREALRSKILHPTQGVAPLLAKIDRVLKETKSNKA